MVAPPIPSFYFLLVCIFFLDDWIAPALPLECLFLHSAPSVPLFFHYIFSTNEKTVSVPTDRCFSSPPFMETSFGFLCWFFPYPLSGFFLFHPEGIYRPITPLLSNKGGGGSLMYPYVTSMMYLALLLLGGGRGCDRYPRMMLHQGSTLVYGR